MAASNRLVDMSFEPVPDGFWRRHKAGRRMAEQDPPYLFRNISRWKEFGERLYLAEEKIKCALIWQLLL